MSDENEFNGTLKEFLQGVKEGDVRGAFVTEKIKNNIVAEISVGPFEYGRVHFRALVDEPRADLDEGDYYRRLYKYEQKYQEAHQSIQEIIESENETETENAHAWQIKDPDKAETFPILPSGFRTDSTYIFEETIALRDDVTIAEALMTNRIENEADD